VVRSWLRIRKLSVFQPCARLSPLCVCTLFPIVTAVPTFILGLLLVVGWGKAFTDSYHADPEHFNFKGFEVEFWVIAAFVGAAPSFSCSLLFSLCWDLQFHFAISRL
jgi:hypothetical protein